MPLCDHFRTNATPLNWQGLQSGWPVVMTQRLNSILPEEYVASPCISLGSAVEYAFPVFEHESVATWAPAKPAVLLETEFPEPSEYEVRIYTQDEYRLVAAIELVSPSNKDRPENRQTFVNTCEAMLKKGVCVTIVDLVTTRVPNLYGELLDELGAPRTAVANSLIYATTCRGERSGLGGGSSRGSTNSPSGASCRRCRSGSRKMSWCRSNSKPRTKTRAVPYGSADVV